MRCPATEIAALFVGAADISHLSVNHRRATVTAHGHVATIRRVGISRKPPLCILHNDRLQALALLLLHVHCLDIAVQLLLGTLLIVTLSRYPDAKSIWNALDARFPDLLVQLRVEAHIAGALGEMSVTCRSKM